MRRAVALAAQAKLPVVATHPLQFLQRDDYEAHEARVCIAEGETLANPRRIKRFSDQQYFKTRAEMAALFADLPSALANSLAVAQRCNLQLTLGKPQLPNFPIPQGPGRGRLLPPAGLRRPGAAAADALSGRCRARAAAPALCRAAQYEIVTILKMGFRAAS